MRLHDETAGGTQPPYPRRKIPRQHSLAMSIMTLPFAEKLISDREPGQLWNYLPDIARGSASDTPESAQSGHSHQTCRRSGCPHADASGTDQKSDDQEAGFPSGIFPCPRGSASSRNSVMWKFWHYEEQLPPPEPRSEKRRRGRRHGRKRSAVPVPAGETAGTCH